MPAVRFLSATRLVRQRKVKLHALKGGLPGKVVPLYVVPLAPALEGRGKGHMPVKRQQKTFFLGYGLFLHIWKF